MTFLSKWRNSIAVLAVSAMLVVASVVFFTAAGDVNEASDSIAQISGLETAVDGVDTGWSYMVRADALAATGEAPEEARVLFDTGLGQGGLVAALAQAAVAPEAIDVVVITPGESFHTYTELCRDIKFRHVHLLPVTRRC